jgi:tetratricopeptide (TPR) repeat protein
LFKYLEIFPIIIIKSKYHILFGSILGLTITVSVLFLAAYINVKAQTVESITQSRKSFGNSPQIMAGSSPYTDTQVNPTTNKIYVVSGSSGFISVVDANSGDSKSMRVGTYSQSIAIVKATDITSLAGLYNVPAQAKVVKHIDSKEMSTLINEGLALANLGNYTGAIEYYNKALAINPKYENEL